MWIEISVIKRQFLVCLGGRAGQNQAFSLQSVAVVRNVTCASNLQEKGFNNFNSTISRDGCPDCCEAKKA